MPPDSYTFFFIHFSGVQRQIDARGQLPCPTGSHSCLSKQIFRVDVHLRLEWMTGAIARSALPFLRATATTYSGAFEIIVIYIVYPWASVKRR